KLPRFLAAHSTRFAEVLDHAGTLHRTARAGAGDARFAAGGDRRRPRGRPRRGRARDLAARVPRSPRARAHPAAPDRAAGGGRLVDVLRPAARAAHADRQRRLEGSALRLDGRGRLRNRQRPPPAGIRVGGGAGSPRPCVRAAGRGTRDRRDAAGADRVDRGAAQVRVPADRGRLRARRDPFREACPVSATVSLLRGINVGGKTNLGMPALAGAYESIGLRDVKTLLRSGNVIFTGNRTAKQIEDAIEKRFAFRPKVFLRTAAELRKTLESNPFPGAARDDPGHLLVMFFETRPD